MRVSLCASMAAAVTLLAGCAPNMSQNDLVRADLAIEQAEVEEASQYAPQQLREAQRKLQQARDASFAGEYEAAEQLAEEALVAAQLARVAADRARIEQLVETALRDIEADRQQQEQREASR